MSAVTALSRRWQLTVLGAVGAIVLAAMIVVSTGEGHAGEWTQAACRELLDTTARGGSVLIENDALQVHAQIIARHATPVDNHLVVAADTELKIAYSATGDEAVQLTGHGPSGQTLQPLWNKHVFAASTSIPDSQDFHSGWNFPTEGCWTVTLQRGDDVAAIPVLIAR